MLNNTIVLLNQYEIKNSIYQYCFYIFIFTVITYLNVFVYFVKKANKQARNNCLQERIQKMCFIATLKFTKAYSTEGTDSLRIMHNPNINSTVYLLIISYTVTKQNYPNKLRACNLHPNNNSIILNKYFHPLVLHSFTKENRPQYYCTEIIKSGNLKYSTGLLFIWQMH